MVKKLLSIAFVVLMTTIGVQAQTLHRNPVRSMDSSLNRIAKAPAKGAGLEDATIWGYTDSQVWGGLGLGTTGIQFSVAIYVPGNSVLKGSTIHGINVPVIDGGITEMTAWVRNTLSGTNLASVQLEAPFTINQYATAVLDEPVTIPEEGLYVGYTFTNTTNYCIPYDYDGAPVDGGLFLDYVYNGQDYGWVNYSDQFPPTPLQLFVTGMTMKDYLINLTSAGTASQLPNSSYSLPVTFTSNGSKAVTSLDVTVTVDGQTENKHIQLAKSVAAGFNQSGSFSIEGTTPDKLGVFGAVIKVTKVNDVDYTEETTATGVLKNLTKVVPRHTVIEEFTGTACGWCPRGWVGMEYMKANYPESFIGIAFHQYNSSDALYYANYPMLGMSGAPGCVIDRKEQTDPYYGSVDMDLGIAMDFERLNAIIPDVDVNVSAKWNEGLTAVNVEADVEFLAKPSSISLVYVLTADSLKGSTTAWKQSNYYYQYSASDVGNAPGLTDFCKNGKYGKSSVSITFNDAVIGSSYDTNGTNQGQTLSAADGYDAGSIYEATYTIEGPTKNAIKSVMDKSLVTAAVLVVDNTTGEILNAGKARVDYPDAIHDIYHSTATSFSARYNMAGQAISAPQRGVNLIHMSDGTVRKVMVK